MSILDLGRLKPRVFGPVCQFIALFVICIVCFLAIVTLQTRAPLYPIGYHTFGWVLALFFPFVAVCFVLYSLRVRLDEVIEHFGRERLWQVYTVSGGQDPEENFKNFLWKRLNDYYNLFELAVLSLLSAAVTFLIYYLISAQFAVPDTSGSSRLLPWDIKGATWAILTGSGFLGSLSGAMVFILRRYRMYDLRPVVFLQISVALVTGTFSGAFITITFPIPELGAFAFIIGFLSAISIDFLPNLMRTRFATLSGTTLPNELRYDLSDIIGNAEVIESLNAISIFSIRELACIDPVRLYLNMPQQIEMINTMVDQALLHFYFPKLHDELEMANIQRFSQLLTAVGYIRSSCELSWPAQINFLDNGGCKDIMLLSAVKGIVEGRQHHRVLGLLIERYREVFFAGGGRSGRDVIDERKL